MQNTNSEHQMSNKSQFKRGVITGIPILLGYLPISFAYAISVVSGGLPWQMAILMSITNFTSSGQFAGANLLITGTPFIEIGMTVVMINIRYLLMSLSLSQKLEKTSLKNKLLLAHGITDEIYFLASKEKGLIKPSFYYGLSLGPYLGWVAGTAMGILLGAVVPAFVSGALGISLYAMFIAIIVPPAKKSRSITFAVAIAVVFAVILYYTPVLNKIPSGWALIICSVTAAGITAVFFPVKPETEHKDAALDAEKEGIDFE